jgi:enoyl-CoA hydratase
MADTADTATNPVSTERRGNVLLIRMDDGRANAVTRELCAAVTAAVREAEADDEVKAIVLAGREGRFSAGFELSVVRGDDRQAIRELCADGAMLVHTLYGSRVPVVAACTGHAIAMGTMIVLGADVRVGPDTDAKLGMTELAIGMALPDWALTILVERVDRKHLQRAAMAAQVYTPAQAVEVGYLDEVVPPEQVLDRALDIATQLAATIHPASYAATVPRLRGAMLATLEAQAEAFRSGGSL